MLLNLPRYAHYKRPVKYKSLYSFHGHTSFVQNVAVDFTTISSRLEDASIPALDRSVSSPALRSNTRINVIQHISTNYILGRWLVLSLHAGALVQKTAFCLAMWEHDYASLHGFDRVGIHAAFPGTREEKGCFSSLELVV